MIKFASQGVFQGLLRNNPCTQILKNPRLYSLSTIQTTQTVKSETLDTMNYQGACQVRSFIFYG